MEVVYGREPDLPAREFVGVLHRSGLAERRPVREPERIAAMLANAGLILTARAPDGLLIGVSRAVTDFSYCCYLSDLAVDRAWQGRGIGRELIRQTREAAGGEGTSLILLSAPAARGWYPKIGMARLDNCFALLRPRPD